MGTDEPLATLHRRLGARPGEPPTDAAQSDDPDEPGWIPDVQPRQAWMSAIRADPGRAGGIALGVIAVMAVLVTVFTQVRHRPAPVVSANLPPVEMVSTTVPTSSTQSSAAPVEPAAPGAVVSVVGLVQQPGLVTLAPTARVADAVAAAGGPLHDADTVGLNLARHVADGEQIVVGLAAPAGQPPVLGSSVGDGTAPGPPAAPAKPVAPVDLNTATLEQLDALPGVGPVTAAAIVAWRTANGRFTAIDQLAEIDGIGPARLEKLRPLVRI